MSWHRLVSPLTQKLYAGSEPDNTREGVMVMDMGLHAIPTLVEPQQIIQVLVPGVEERARHLPPLTSSSRLMPGQIGTRIVQWSSPCIEQSSV